jgi:hypothetical protein
MRLLSSHPHRRGRLASLAVAAGLVAVPVLAGAGSRAVASEAPRGAAASDPAPLLRHNAGLRGVDGVSADDVWAVGFEAPRGFHPDSPLTLHYDGARWAAVPTPDIEGGLLSVTAIAPDDVWAVGSQDLSGNSGFLSLHWDGTAWAQVDVPATGQQYDTLVSVSSVSPHQVLAIGHSSTGEGPVITTRFGWNGRSWHVVGHGPLRGVSALAGTRSDAWAVGETHAGATLARHGQGRSWHRVDTPNLQTPNTLSAAASAGATNVWAAGTVDASGEPLAEHWDGTSWALEDKGFADTAANVEALATAPDGSAWLGLGTSSQQDLYQWDGSGWQATDNPVSAFSDGLLGDIKAFSADDAWAVGSWYLCDGSTFCYDKRILSHWDGSTWTSYQR